MASPAPKLNVAVLDHQGKSRAIQDALLRAGCRLVGDPVAADAILIDHDVPTHGKLQHAERCVAAGGRTFLYPHGAQAGLMAMWDGLFPISPILAGALVPAPGHAEVARRFGYPHPVHVIGWSLCELRPRVRRPVRNVLFAPTHPPGHPPGADPLAPWKAEWNARTFARLLETPAKITVRHLGSVEANGLWRADGVDYVSGDISNFPEMLAQLDEADVVVGDRGTFSCLAIARGITTVISDSSGIATNADANHRPTHIDRYRDYIRYPFDTEDGDLWQVMQAAAEDVELVADWRARFIGDPISPDALVEALRGDGAHLQPAVRAKRLHGAALESVVRGDARGADAYLSEAIAASLDLELLNDLAVVRWSQGRHDEARSLLGACLAIDPSHAGALENLAAITATAAAA